jgi:lactoylglutathione lyase
VVESCSASDDNFADGAAQPLGLRITEDKIDLTKLGDSIRCDGVVLGGVREHGHVRRGFNHGALHLRVACDHGGEAHARVQRAGTQKRPIGAVRTNRGLRLHTEKLSRLVRPCAACEHQFHARIAGEERRDIQRCGDHGERPWRVRLCEQLCKREGGAPRVDEQRVVRRDACDGRLCNGALRTDADIKTLAHRQRVGVERDGAAVCFLDESTGRKQPEIPADGVLRAGVLGGERCNLDAALFAQRGGNACLALLSEPGALVASGRGEPLRLGSAVFVMARHWRVLQSMTGEVRSCTNIAQPHDALGVSSDSSGLTLPRPMLEHVALWTPDLERARSFYERYFGGRPNDRYENPTYGFASYFLTFPGGSRLELMQMPGIAARELPPEIQAMGLVHLAFCPGDETAVEELTERLRADGYAVIGEARRTGDGYYESTVLDPDGNRLEIAALPRA